MLSKRMNVRFGIGSLIGLAACLGVCLGTGLVPAAAQETAKVPPVGERERPAPIVVPIDHANGHICVDVWIGDRGPFLFQVDTYASFKVCVDDDFARELGLEVVGTTMNSDGIKSIARDLVEVPGLRIGEQEFPATKALVDDYDWVGGDEYKLCGLLGFPLFQKLLWSIDYPNSQLILAEGSLKRGDPHCMTFSKRSGAPDIFLELDGERVRFGIDTGLESAMMLLSSDVKRFDFVEQPAVIGSAQSAYSTFDIYGGTLAQPFEFAGHAVADLDVTLREGEGLRLIGRELMKPYVVTFDQRSRLVRFMLPKAVADSPAR